MTTACLIRTGLKVCERAFDAAPDHLIGGHTINALPQNPFSSASQDLVDYLCGYFDGKDGRTRLFTSNNMAVRADHFHAAGGFDTRFPRAAGEDREFCDRWIAQGRGTTLVARRHRDARAFVDIADILAAALRLRSRRRVFSARARRTSRRGGSRGADVLLRGAPEVPVQRRSDLRCSREWRCSSC